MKQRPLRKESAISKIPLAPNQFAVGILNIYHQIFQVNGEPYQSGISKPEEAVKIFESYEEAFAFGESLELKDGYEFYIMNAEHRVIHPDPEKDRYTTSKLPPRETFIDKIKKMFIKKT